MSKDDVKSGIVLETPHGLRVIGLRSLNGRTMFDDGSGDAPPACSTFAETGIASPKIGHAIQSYLQRLGYQNCFVIQDGIVRRIAHSSPDGVITKGDLRKSVIRAARAALEGL